MDKLELTKVVTMEVINELKEFDSLHNEWKNLGRQISFEELPTEMSGDDNDAYGFKYGYFRKITKTKVGLIM